jgi:hypothetical protein
MSEQISVLVPKVLIFWRHLKKKKEFLDIDPEVWVRFSALPDFLV